MGSNNNNKGKAPKVHPGESFADAVREGTPADPNGDQNARLKPGETYADAVQEGLPENSSSSDAPPAYTANGAKASDSKTPSSTQAQTQSSSSSQQTKSHALHLPNSHHSHRLGSPSPSPSPGGHRHHSHPHSHHFSTGGGGGGGPTGGIFAAQFGPGGGEEVIMVPEREYIYALMRARRRFWATLFWALLIYLVAG